MGTNLKTRQMTFVSKPITLLVFTFLLGMALYLPTLSYDFVGDDFVLIKNNPQIKTLHHWPQLLVSKFPIWQYSFLYRPLSIFSLALDYFLFKENPWGYHLTNAIIHGVNSSLVTYLALLLLQNPYSALIAGALFALHPAHPEAVALISGRTDLLCTFFSLLALKALIKKSEKSRDLGLLLFAPLFLFLALLSKETAVVVLIPMAILLYRKSPEEPKRLQAAMLKIVPSSLMVILYLLLRYQVFNSFFLKPKLLYSPFFLFELFLRYLSFLILPPQRVPFFLYTKNSYYSLDFKFWIFLGLTILFVTAIIYVIYRQRETAPFFALLILPCLPSLYFSLYNYIIMIERFLYLPTVGLALLVGWGFLHLPHQRKKWAVLGISVILVVYWGATLWRMPLYKHNVVLYQALKEEYPSVSYIRALLGMAYKDQNRLMEAYQELSAAISLDPEDPINQTDFGWICLQLGWTQKAREAFEKALKSLPDFASALEGMGSTYGAEGDYETALKYLDLALAADPLRTSSIMEKRNFILSVQPTLRKQTEKKYP